VLRRKRLRIEIDEPTQRRDQDRPFVIGKVQMHCSNMARKRNPQTRLAMNWHLDVIAVKLTACAKAGSGALSSSCRRGI